MIDFILEYALQVVVFGSLMAVGIYFTTAKNHERRLFYSGRIGSIAGLVYGLANYLLNLATN